MPGLEIHIKKQPQKCHSHSTVHWQCWCRLPCLDAPGLHRKVRHNGANGMQHQQQQLLNMGYIIIPAEGRKGPWLPIARQRCRLHCTALRAVKQGDVKLFAFKVAKSVTHHCALQCSGKNPTKIDQNQNSAERQSHVIVTRVHACDYVEHDFSCLVDIMHEGSYTS